MEITQETSREGNYDVHTVSATAKKLTDQSFKADRGVLVRASKNNNGTVYIGFSDKVTSSRGMPLYPGDSLNLPIDRTDFVWLIGTSSDKVAWMSA